VDEACLALLRQGGQHQQSGGNLKQTLVLENKFITYYSFFITHYSLFITHYQYPNSLMRIRLNKSFEAVTFPFK